MKAFLREQLTDRNILLGLATSAVILFAAGISFASIVAVILALATAISGQQSAATAYWDGLIDNFFDELDELDLFEDDEIPATTRH